MSGAAVLLSRHDGALVSAERDFKNEYDLAARIFQMARVADDVVIENVWSMPGQGVVSMFSFGEAYGAAKGALAAAGWPITSVTTVVPQVWQRFAKTLVPEAVWQKTDPKTGKVEFDARAVALRLFPGSEALFKRIKDHNTADAALIGLWKLKAAAAQTATARAGSR